MSAARASCGNASRVTAGDRAFAGECRCGAGRRPEVAVLGRRRKRYVRGVLAEVVDSVAEQTGFAGVVSVDRGGENEFARAYGLAHRAHKIPNAIDTRFAIASGTKGLTALTVVSLIEHNGLRLSTAARSVLGTDL